MASSNTDIKNNFIRVEDMGSKSSAFQVGGNAGYLNTRDDLGGSTTPSHEDGHGLGLDHDLSGQTATDRPDITTPRHSKVNPRWSISGPSNDIDPNFRRVTAQNVNDVLRGVTFDSNSVGKIGTVTNTIFDKNGN